MRAGLAEAVKLGAIADRGLFRLLERRAADLKAGRPETIAAAVAAAAARKAAIVSRDEREGGERILLNFGHTLGHALEAACGYRLLHGEAVARGVALEARLASRLGALDEADRRRIVALLEALGLHLDPPHPRPSTDRIMRAAALDKKSKSGRLRWVLPSGIGRHAGGSDFSLNAPARVARAVVEEYLRCGHP